LNGEDREDIRTKRTPKWEYELWSHLSRGDGIRCPLYNHCRVRHLGGLYLCSHKSGHRKFRAAIGDSKLYLGNFDIQRTRESVRWQSCRISRLVEMAAKKSLSTLGNLRLPIPSRLVSLADEQSPIEVRLLPLKTCHGAVWRLTDKWVIHLNSNEAYADQQFTLLHEAFHILAHIHCSTNPVFNRRGFKKGDFNELLADYFAASILMPTEVARKR